jgi:glutathione synthase
MDKKEFLNDPASVLPSNGRWMIQPYDPEVESTGDRRGFFFNGSYYGSVGRMPKSGGFIANFAQGGSAADQPLSDREKSLIAKMEAWLKKTGIVFAGSDFIGGRLSEVNITCPTGFAAYEDLYGEDPAKTMFDKAFGAES